MVADAVLESANAKLIGIVHATCEHLINELRAEVRDLQTVVQDQGRMIEALKAQVVETAAPASALVSTSLASLQAPNPVLPPPAVPTESAPVSIPAPSSGSAAASLPAPASLSAPASVPAPTQASVQVSPGRNVIKAKRGGPPGVRVSSAGLSPTRPTSMSRPPGEDGLREQCPVPGGPATHFVPVAAPAAPPAVIAPDPTGSDANDQPAAASQQQCHDVPDTGSTGVLEAHGAPPAESASVPSISMSSPTGAALEDSTQPAPSESRDTLTATPVGEEPTTTEENAVVQSNASDLVQSPVQDEEAYSTNGEVEDVEEGELSGDGEEGTGEQASQVAVPMDTD